MLDIKYSAKFKKDWKAIAKRKYSSILFEEVVEMLRTQIPLPEKYHDHALTGNWTGHRECHISSDWLLIYKIKNEELLLILTRTGTHSDLFEE